MREAAPTASSVPKIEAFGFRATGNVAGALVLFVASFLPAILFYLLIYPHTISHHPLVTQKGS